MFKKKSFTGTIVVLTMVMLINALSYGTIIPLLYPYASRFGLNATGLSLLFASYSICQFLATPVIGRFSDKYGRRPLLLLSLLGTAVSLSLFASANSVIMLFVARMLDGATGGNISVAQAVIADTQKPEARAKWFAMLGAAFGFGFLIGPAMGGLLSHYGLTVPFWVAAFISVIGVILTFFLLPETRSSETKSANFDQRQEKVFDFKKLLSALRTPTSGILLLITLLASIGQNAFVIGFQSVTVDVFRFSTTQIGLLFSAFGLTNVLMQGFGVRLLLKKFSTRVLTIWSLILGVFFVSLLSLALSPIWFVLFIGLYMFVPPSAPFISALISNSAKSEDQGGILGLSQSYTSLGQIIGPLMAGIVVMFSSPAVFLLSSGVWLLGAYLVTKIPQKNSKIDL
jgi:MFS transporter, DHA1 family, tetracycline resistance protein